MNPLVVEGGQIVSLFLVLVRCTGMVIVAPLFGHRSLPAPVKAALAIGLAIALVPGASAAAGATPAPLAVPLELLIGLTLGYLMSLGFYAMETAGRLISLQLGLSLDAVLGPMRDGSSTALDPFFSVLAGVVYLALGFHVEAVRILGGSFTAFPIGGAWPVDLWLLVGRIVVLSLDLATRIALPLALTLLLVELFVGLTSRAIPQLNVFVLGLPVKLLVGMGVIAFVTPSLATAAGHAFQVLFAEIAAGGIVSTGR